MNHMQTRKHSSSRCCTAQNEINSETKNEFSGCNETQEYHWCPFGATTKTATTIATMTHSRRAAHDSLPFKRRNMIFTVLAVVITVLSWCDPVSTVTKHANYIARKTGESHICR